LLKTRAGGAVAEETNLDAIFVTDIVKVVAFVELGVRCDDSREHLDAIDAE
jgi:hypothetical protein